MKNLYKIEDELYIISNNESINENDHIITQDGRLVEVSYLLAKDVQGGHKVILTTNKLLINDGVQAIPDEFLEWFVKNQICEKVKVEGHIYKGQDETEYKIIILKEEQKQHLIDIMKSDEELGLYEQTKCYCGHTTYCDCGALEEPKQEIELVNGFIPTSVFNKQETFEEIIGKKVTDYCEQYKGTDKYNVAMLAIEFGYQLAKEKQEECSCTDECLGYLTKTCKNISEKEETIEEATEKFIKFKRNHEK
jgi:hypothetical protein